MYWDDMGRSQDRAQAPTTGGSRYNGSMRAAAAVLALIAVLCMSVAIVGMVTGRPGDKAGLLWRVAAVACFAAAVALNVAAH